MRLMDIPHIDILIQYEHPKLVARVEDRLARRVMRGADRVIPRFFQQRDLSLFRKRMTDRAQDTVVVMDAGAEQQRPLAVDPKDVFRVDLDGADAEANLLHILAIGQAAGIEVRFLGRPKSGALDIDSAAPEETVSDFNNFFPSRISTLTVPIPVVLNDTRTLRVAQSSVFTAMLSEKMCSFGRLTSVTGR